MRLFGQNKFTGISFHHLMNFFYIYFTIFRYTAIKYRISAAAVRDQEHKYNRYSDCMVPKYAKTVYIQTILNTQDPIMTMMVGRILLPSPLEAAMEQTINADTA